MLILQAILLGAPVFEEFVRTFLGKHYPSGSVPEWVCDALGLAGIDVTDMHPSTASEDHGREAIIAENLTPGTGTDVGGSASASASASASSCGSDEKKVSRASKRSREAVSDEFGAQESVDL